MNERYDARFQNGYWSLFDRRFFAPVDTFPDLERAAEAAKQANTDGRWRVSAYAIYEHPWRLSHA